LEQHFPKGACEDAIAIRDDRVWHAMELDHSVDKDTSHGWGCERVSKGNKVGKLGETINHDQNAVISIR
jgi:hypothetical protein